ncbi:E3 ubiquitin-protein ligase MYCBP2-like, partial [Saccoglossus kowalevskii]
MTYHIGSNTDDVKKAKQVEIESRQSGWLTWNIPDNSKVVKIDLKGPDNSLRVRQIKILGISDGENINVGPMVSSTVKQQKDCESETLKVFRLLTSQVFGRLFADDDDNIDGKEVNKDKKEDKEK